MTSRSQPTTLHIVPDVIGDLNLFRKWMRDIGVRFQKVNVTRGHIPTYRVSVPRNAEVLVMGDAVSYVQVPGQTKSIRRFHADNREILGMYAALAKHPRVTCLAGTNELDVIDVLQRHDHKTHKPEDIIRKALLELIAEGHIVHSAVVDIRGGIVVSPDLLQRFPDLDLSANFLATHAGGSLGIWRHCGSPERASEENAVLNQELVDAARAILESHDDPDVHVRLPPSVAPSKYVQKQEVDVLSSPTTADPREIHRWGDEAFARYRIPQLRTHSTIEIDADHHDGTRLPIEIISVGGVPCRAIMARGCPIISVHPDDQLRDEKGPVAVEGISYAFFPTGTETKTGRPIYSETPMDSDPAALLYREPAVVSGAVGRLSRRRSQARW